MPIFKESIEYFTCQFKCGQKAMQLNSMKRHEAKCFCNPENKACRMCKHLKVDPLYNECEQYKYYINTDKPYIVYNESDAEIYNKETEHLLMAGSIFYAPKERPFPKTDCILFELGKKAY